MDLKEIYERIDFNESRIREVIKDLHGLRLIIDNLKPDIEKIDLPYDDIIRNLLISEDFRVKYAIMISKYFRDAAKLLGMSERNFYRKLKNLGINSNNKENILLQYEQLSKR